MNIISKEETDNILDEEINIYLKEFKEDIEETKNYFNRNYKEMVFQFHKINTNTRKYIEIKLKEYYEKKIWK